MRVNQEAIHDALTGEVTMRDYTAEENAEVDAGIADAVRMDRNMRLETEVDPVVSNALRWAEMSTEQQNLWAQYRTDLLNVPQQDEFPHNVTWPTKP